MRAYAPNPTPERAAGLGREFELMRTAVSYPSCRWPCRHRRSAGAAGGTRPGAGSESVTYGLSSAGMLLVGLPRKTIHKMWSWTVSAFVLATALATGAMGWDSYRLLDDPAIRGLL